MLGVGNMSGAILDGLTRPGYGPEAPVRVTNRSASSAARYEGRPRVVAAATEHEPRANRDAVRGAGVVVLGVKPTMVADLLDEVRDDLEPGAVVVSVAAGVTIDSIERRLEPGVRVVRAMPNTPATIGLGVTGIAAGTAADDEAMRLATALFSAVGEVVEVDEQQINLVGAISGSGPAYLYYFVEALVRSAEQHGLAAERARALVVGTVRGASEMLVRNPELDPAELRRRVTSPKGTTERAVQAFEAGEFADVVDRAVRANLDRARELAAENG